MLARKPEDRPHDAFAVHDSLIDILRRYGSSPPPAMHGHGSIPALAVAEPRRTDLHGREQLDTMVDSALPETPQAGIKTANVGKAQTREMSSRWASALTELENVIARARKKGGRYAAGAARATEIARLAQDMIPRIERAARVVADAQARVDRLEAEGREFRANLGHAIDVLVHDRSRERAHLEAMTGRHLTIDAAPPSDGNLDARAWERAALAEEEGHTHTVVDDLGYQIAELQTTLDKRNETHDKIMVAAAGALEGSLAALRHLQSELVRTIDDGIRVVSLDKTSPKRF
jgi:hypothetical protein